MAENPSPDSPARPNISVYPILTINFVGTLGFSIVLPFLVFLVTRWGGNALIYGIMGATYSAFQLVGAPILGRWSDSYGRRKILLLSQLGTLFSWMLFMVALYLPVTSLWQSESGPLGAFTLTLPLLVLFVARALDGLTGGNISVANAYLADITSDERRNANFGKMSVSGNLGFIIGPALAGVLGGTILGETLPVAAALAISLAASLLIIFGLPESRPCEIVPTGGSVTKIFGQEHRDCYEASAGERPSIKQILSLERIPYLLALYFMIFLGFNFFYIAFPVHAVKALAWTVRDTGVFFAVTSLVMVIVQGPVLSRMSRRWSDVSLALFGSAILATSFLFFTTQDKALIYAGTGLMGLGNGLMWPSFMAILSRAAGQKYQGAVQGFAGSCGAVASIIGLIVGGILYDTLQGRVFLMSAAIIFLAFLMMVRLAAKKS